MWQWMFVSVIIGLWAVQVCADEEAANQDVPNEHLLLVGEEYAALLQQLSSDDTSDRLRAYQLIKRKQVALVRHLIDTVDQDFEGKPIQGHDPRELAAKLLADIGAREAIPVLVRRIDHLRGELAEEPLPAGLYPNALALGRFGESGVTGILFHLGLADSQNVSEIVIDLYAAVLVNVYYGRPDPFGAAVRRVDDAINETANPKSLKRLRAAILELR